MAGPGDIEDLHLRALVEEARRQMLARNFTRSVHASADAFIELLEHHPELMDETFEPRPGVRVPVVMRWPRLGANLQADSVAARRPRVEFERDSFGMLDAMNYYEYTLSFVLQAQRKAELR